MTRVVRNMVLGVLAASLIGCQGPVTIASPTASSSVEDAARLLDLTMVDAATLAPDADDTLVVPLTTAGPVELPVAYPRGVAERIRWLGSEAGTATLLNEHGQVVYKVGQDGTSFEGEIPAGAYTLRIDAAGKLPLFVEVTQEGLTQVRTFQMLNGEAPSRGESESLGCSEIKSMLYSAASAASLLRKMYPARRMHQKRIFTSSSTQGI